ncbi:MAG: triose-phosphate isomerase [Alphaproteobacteria bacterium]|nr:triose-phosphate isomerase [Alphaproteobacteria bacterium]MDX5370153.1 triose-phosphate isomerase [Alphaproteobacteria bacterium]MDX5464710.1 triose-phosphate isomerase [Alphaproteobacteria bacterium]
MTRTPLVAGNWKMNGLASYLDEAQAIARGADAHAGACEVTLCPPATLLSRLADAISGTAAAAGGQDCHAGASGAHTGDIAAEMLADAGARAVILGHSERRADHGEGDAAVRAKVLAAHRAGLVAIVCVGETEAQRDAGQALGVVRAQLAGSLPDEGVSGETVVVAYEPVWAIGTGRTPVEADIAEVHAAMRAALAERYGPETADAIRLLYGGSVKAGNAAAIAGVADVDGALVGGASLKAADFLPIVEAFAGRG